MATTRPNVIIILTDDQGYGDLACHGNPVALTPHLDRLHGESVRLTDFHAAPMCTPTRGQLMTGLDAARNGALNVSSGRTLLRSDLPTMADAFRNAGYSTGMFGKWHLGDNYPYRPQDRGFDETLWFPSSHISSAPDHWENDYFDDVYCRNGERVRHTGYCTEVFFDEAIRWVGERKQNDEPFFLYLPTNAPHSPLWVPKEDLRVVEEYFARHEHLLPELRPHLRACIVRFLAMIRNLDTQIGRLRAFLDEQDLADDTLLMFMTDNGSTFGHQYFNAGMRGNKTTLWEGGHRVPCFLHWPNGGLGEPRDIPGLTEFQDLLPTVATLCGLNTGPGDGVDLAPSLRGDGAPPEDRMLVVNYSRMPGAMDYPSPDADSFVRREGAGVLWKRWRLLQTDQLYDLDADPAQERNVIDDHPDVARAMLDHLDAWWADVEVAANELQRVTIGHAAENPSMLSACEWADVFVDQQQQIRVGVQKNSYWRVHVAQEGEYTFELRRWPEESGLGLMDACPETAVPEEGLMPSALIAGTPLPIAWARLRIDGDTHVQEVGPDAQSARFTLNLKAGPALLHTWFDDARRQPICGAYYVYVERKG
jgi:arylsulfatase